MTEDLVPIQVGNSSVAAVRNRPARARPNLRFVYAPGAGSDLFDPFGTFLSMHLAESGIESWRFQFPYMEAHRRRPDAPAVLEATWRAVISAADLPPGSSIVGGRSMGGRIASQVVAQGLPARGLVLFAYPLHLPGRPEQRRDRHLRSISIPTLFCSGTRDSFASAEEITAAADLVPNARVHLLEDADHGFKVLRRSGRSQPDVWNEAFACLLSFAQELSDSES